MENPKVDPTLLYDFTELGYLYAKKGYLTIKPWKEQMLDEWGEKVSPYLDDIWKQINDGGDIEANHAKFKGVARSAYAVSAFEDVSKTTSTAKAARARKAQNDENTHRGNIISDEVKCWLRNLAAGLILLLVALAFLYVWPGVYRYQYCMMNDVSENLYSNRSYNYDVLVRVDKLTGKSQVCKVAAIKK